MKNCISCGKLNENPLLKYCRLCFYENTIPKPKTPIKQISDKRKFKINNWWGEKDLFKMIWNKRNHNCELCWKNINTPRIHHFDHKIPKSKWEQYRLDENNIQIVCFACHFKKTTWLNYKWPDLD